MIHHIVTDLSKMDYLKTVGWTLFNLPERGVSKMAWKTTNQRTGKGKQRKKSSMCACSCYFNVL